MKLRLLASKLSFGCNYIMRVPGNSCFARPFGRQLTFRPSSSRTFSALTRLRSLVELAYDKHDPPADVSATGPANPPILFLHGLFGTRKNNRAMSKYVAVPGVDTRVIRMCTVCGRNCVTQSIPRIKANWTLYPFYFRILARDLNRTIYALDLRNHGDSPHDETHTYRAMASDIAHFIAEHELVNPSIIGHSMGSKVAMTVALKDPSLVESIVSVDNAPIDAELMTNFPAYVKAMKKVTDTGVKRQADADAILAKTIPVRAGYSG